MAEPGLGLPLAEPRKRGLRVGREGGNGVVVDMCRLRACCGEGPRAGSGMIAGGVRAWERWGRGRTSLEVRGLAVRSVGREPQP
jgi:hypothetical protein